MEVHVSSFDSDARNSSYAYSLPDESVWKRSWIKPNIHFYLSVCHVSLKVEIIHAIEQELSSIEKGRRDINLLRVVNPDLPKLPRDVFIGL